MYTLIAFIARFLNRRNTALGHAFVPRQLLESAEGRAGSNPRQASELRLAARAYMRVVR